MKTTLVFGAALALSACKAEKVEISLDAEVIMAAAGGAHQEVEFEAVVGERYTTVDDEKRAIIGSVSQSIEKYFPGSEIDVDIGSDEYEIDVEGTLAVSSVTPSSGAPWHISATTSKDGEGVLVQLLPSGTFGAFEGELQNVNSMLGPDEFQPVEFKFTANSGTVIVGGAIVDGLPVGVARIPMSGQTIKMLFESGVWEQTSGAFLYVP